MGMTKKVKVLVAGVFSRLNQDDPRLGHGAQNADEGDVIDVPQGPYADSLVADGFAAFVTAAEEAPAEEEPKPKRKPSSRRPSKSRAKVRHVKEATDEEVIEARGA